MWKDRDILGSVGKCSVEEIDIVVEDLSREDENSHLLRAILIQSQKGGCQDIMPLTYLSGY